jgi:hypothetical protein
MHVGTALTDYPVTNLGEILNPYLVWRSSSNDPEVKLDLGSSQAMGAVMLHQANFTSCLIWTATAANPSGGDWLALGTAHVLNTDVKTGRRKRWVTISRTARWLRIAPDDTTTGGAPHVEMGVAALMGTVTTLNDYFGVPSDYIIRRARTVIQPRGGSVNVNSEGPPYVEFSLRNDRFKKVTAVLPQLQALALEMGPVAIYENATGGPNPEACYLCDKPEDMSFDERATVFGSAIRLVERV